jgi:pimeloyl-ACP methyl ester carboxylesterase
MSVLCDASSADRLRLLSATRTGGPRYYLYSPSTRARADTILVAVHGISRDAREQALAWRPLAHALGCTLIAPLFDRYGAHAYQRLGWNGEGSRADQLLDAIVAQVRDEIARPRAKLLLCGYSGGAQFCHRYAMAYPDRVHALIAGAAGWYTWPDAARPWPSGLDTSSFGDERRVDLDGFLRVPALVYVGDRDEERGAALRSSPELDAWQGADRRERARRWVAALRRAALERGLPSRAELLVLPRVAHEFAAAMRAGIVSAAEQWVLGGSSPTTQRAEHTLPLAGENHV